MSKKPTVLMILDGYGLNDRHEGNAIYEAKTPVMDKLMTEYPFVKGNASGLAVGLPDGQMGNSEAVSYIRNLPESQKKSTMEISSRMKHFLQQ